MIDLDSWLSALSDRDGPNSGLKSRLSKTVVDSNRWQAGVRTRNFMLRFDIRFQTFCDLVAPKRCWLKLISCTYSLCTIVPFEMAIPCRQSVEFLTNCWSRLGIEGPSLD